MCVREDKLWNSTFLLKRGLFIHFMPTILRKPRTLEFSTKSWTRLWTFCIGMGLFECVKAKKTSESGPFSFNMDFSYISCVQYWGKLDIWSHSSHFEPGCGPFALAWDFLNVWKQRKPLKVYLSPLTWTFYLWHSMHTKFWKTGSLGS